jgi:TrpR-related protein YerC/YecD
MKKFKMDTFSTHTPDDYPTKEMKELFQVILMLKTEKDVQDFFRDLLTMAELKEFSNRWQMVRMLSAGRPYLEISQTLGVSTTTVARVAYWLNNGAGGYTQIIDLLKSQRYAKRIKDIPKNEFERTLRDISRMRK